MRIKSIETEIIATQLADEGFTTTYGQEPTTRHHVIVKITSDSGVIGVGEGCPLPFTDDDDPVKINELIENQQPPFVIGKNPSNEEIYAGITDRFPKVGGTARTGVDLALYDLVGNLENKPVYEILGGLLRDNVEIAGVLGIGAPETIAEEAVSQIKSGMKSVKIKVGVDVEQDIETLTCVREFVGESARIRADANTGYSVKQALRFLKICEDMNLEYLEQPLPVENYKGFNQLRKSTSIPIMADESVYTFEDAQTLIRHQAIDMLGLKLIKHGGIFQTKRIADLAEENDIECVIISPWETQIGVSAAVHLVLSGENFNHPHEIAPGSLAGDPFHGLVEMKGVYLPPTSAGLGISEN